MKYVKGATLVVALTAAAAATSSSQGEPRHATSGHAAAAGHASETGPVAVYWMSASTSTGMSGAGAGPGGRPNMAMMMRGGSSFDPSAVSHTLILQLGSTRHPDGDPAAEHDPPDGLGAGPVLPLVTPEAQAPAAHEEAPSGPPPQSQPPRGRMLIFWGCGEHAGPGQPYVIDFANLAATDAAQKFAGLTHGITVTPMQPPSPARFATYGEWPNARTDTSVPPQGSLAGDHVVKGNYSPDIHFTLTPQQDFLPPFNMTTNQKNPSGSASLGWEAMQGVQGFFATMFGAGGQDVVMWTSSQVQAPAFGVPDYLSDSEIARLVAAHVLMPPSQTQCVIPVEAVQAAGEAGFYQLIGYGAEANFAYPPRPPAPQPWHIDWTAKVRYRTATGGLVGMDMSRMMGGHRGQQQQQQQQQQQPHHGFGIPGLGGFLP